jgi:hypothetical protein
LRRWRGLPWYRQMVAEANVVAAIRHLVAAGG